GTDVLDSAFAKVLRSGVLGVVMVLDQQVQPLTRVWCLFEFLLSSELQLEVVFATELGVLGDQLASPDIALQIGRKLQQNMQNLADATETLLLEQALAQQLFPQSCGQLQIMSIRRLETYGSLMRLKGAICTEMRIVYTMYTWVAALAALLGAVRSEAFPAGTAPAEVRPLRLRRFQDCESLGLEQLARWCHGGTLPPRCFQLEPGAALPRRCQLRGPTTPGSMGPGASLLGEPGEGTPGLAGGDLLLSGRLHFLSLRLDLGSLTLEDAEVRMSHNQTSERSEVERGGAFSAGTVTLRRSNLTVEGTTRAQVGGGFYADNLCLDCLFLWYDCRLISRWKLVKTSEQHIGLVCAYGPLPRSGSVLDVLRLRFLRPLVAKDTLARLELVRLWKFCEW
ncbi:hypothetical protein AK812_SmicGene45515, partial [Symbiodinium microadriaticum]